MSAKNDGSGLRCPWSRARRPLTILVIATIAVIVAAASDKPPKAYPEHGKVTGMRTELETSGGGVYTDADGGVHGRRVETDRVPVYLLRTTEMEYEIEGKRLSIGNVVDFRVDKDRLNIKAADKEVKYRVVGQRVIGPGASQ
jgi:hypothetical protein